MIASEEIYFPNERILILYHIEKHTINFFRIIQILLGLFITSLNFYYEYYLIVKKANTIKSVAIMANQVYCIMKKNGYDL